MGSLGPSSPISPILASSAATWLAVGLRGTRRYPAMSHPTAGAALGFSASTYLSGGSASAGSAKDTTVSGSTSSARDLPSRKDTRDGS